MAVLDRITIGDIEFLHVDAAPGGGAGTAADIGSVASFDNAGAGEMYLKTGAADTAWTQLDAGTLPIDLTTDVGVSILPVANGGTGLDASTVLAGQILIGNDTNNDFDLATLTAGNGVNITNADGSITIAAENVQASTSVQTTDATQTVLKTFDMSTADTVYYVKARVKAIVSGGAGGNDQASAVFERSIRVTNDGGVLIAGKTQSDYTDKSPAVSSYSVDFNVSGTDLQLRVTGGATDNTEWKFDGLMDFET